jgi:hypothetical protein
MSSAANDPVRARPRWVTMMAGAYLLLMYAGLCAVVYISGHAQDLLAGQATRNPASFSTPQILVGPVLDESRLKLEDFSNNQRSWSGNVANGKVEVASGRLLLQTSSDELAVAFSQTFKPDSGLQYDLQADFSRDSKEAEAYGMIFGFNAAARRFYAFQVAPRFGVVSLLKYDQGTWQTLIQDHRVEMNAYPESNTLGVHFEMGAIALYVNGQPAGDYLDESPYQAGGVGVFASGRGYRLVVDNFFIFRRD